MRYHLIALFTVGVWGATFVSTKILLSDLKPLWILLFRFVIGFSALCILKPHTLKLDDKRHEVLFVIAGATGIASYYLLENIALVYTSATAVGVIVAASPLFTALISTATKAGFRIDRRFFSGFILAMSGLIIVGISGDPDAFDLSGDHLSLFGNLLALLAAFVWAIYSTVVQRISDLGYETVSATKRTFAWGITFILPATLIFGGAAPTIDALLDSENILNMVFLGLIASAVCFATWSSAVKHLGATISTTYIYLVPAITAVTSMAILNEAITMPIAIGIAMTISGLMISQNREKDQATVGGIIRLDTRSENTTDT